MQGPGRHGRKVNRAGQGNCGRVCVVEESASAAAGLRSDEDLRGIVADLLPTLRAFAIPMPTKFRGTTLREGALLHGPAGWGEFSPFPDYGPRECAR